VSGLTGVPEYLDVNATYVVFDEVNAGTIKRVPIGGGTPVTLATGQTAPQGLALGGASVYWVGGTAAASPSGYVASVPIVGGSVFTATGTIGTLPTEVIVNGSQPYWTAQGGTLGTLGGVFTLPPPDGGLTTSSNLASEPNALGIAADSLNVYFSIFPQGTLAMTAPRVQMIQVAPPSDGGGSSSGVLPPLDSGGSSGGTTCLGCAAVARVPLAGGGVTTLASGLASPTMVAVDSTSVYWADQSNGTVMSVPIVGGGSVTLASGQSGPLPIRSDGQHVFWGNASGGQLMSVAVGGGAPVTLATGQPNIRDIALGGSCIYWTTGQSNTVMKIGKP
jgi:hypothetical protein